MRKKCRGSAPEPAGEAYSAPPVPLSTLGGRFAEEKGGERDGRKGMRRVKGGRRGTEREGDDAGR